MMRSSLTLVVAALLLGQAFANAPVTKIPTDKEYKKADKVVPVLNTKPPVAPKGAPVPYVWGSTAAKDGYNSNAAPSPAFPPMTCNGHSYCFPGASSPKASKPVCPKGFTMDPSGAKCFKYTGYTCPKGAYECADKSICLTCPKHMELGSDGMCAYPCKKGYEEVYCSAGRFCVKTCKSGKYPAGDRCVSFEEYYYPKKCDGKCKPDYVYMGNAASNDAAAKAIYDYSPYGAAYKTADAKAKPMVATAYKQMYGGNDGYAATAQECVCTKTDKRDAKEQKVQEPGKVPSYANLIWTTPVCADGTKPDYKSNSCAVSCPTGASLDNDGMCQHACPTGFKKCAKAATSFCATVHDVFGCDSCDVMGQLIQWFDTTRKCPDPYVVAPTMVPVKVAVPAPKPVYPAPAPTPYKAPASSSGSKKAPASSSKKAPAGKY